MTPFDEPLPSESWRPLGASVAPSPTAAFSTHVALNIGKNLKFFPLDTYPLKNVRQFWHLLDICWEVWHLLTFVVINSRLWHLREFFRWFRLLLKKKLEANSCAIGWRGKKSHRWKTNSRSSRGSLPINLMISWQAISGYKTNNILLETSCNTKNKVPLDRVTSRPQTRCHKGGKERQTNRFNPPQPVWSWPRQNLVGENIECCPLGMWAQILNTPPPRTKQCPSTEQCRIP